MEQPELGKTEDETTATLSSAELSELETAPTSDVENAPTVEEESHTPTASDEEENAETADNTAKTTSTNGLTRGMLIDGTIAITSPTQVTVDLGEGRMGIIPNTEIERLDKKRLEDFVVGNVIRLMVVNPNNKDGNIILSYNHALEETDWQMAEEYRQSKDVYHGKIGGYNKGGLIVRFGRLRGFIPQSQISDVRLSNLQGETPEQRYGLLINKTIDVKVMEVDRQRNRLILSERAALRDVRKARKEALITELQVGEIRDGVVVSLENFGAFIDIGGAEGLAHLTEISHHHITHPRQALTVGEKVRVKVKEIDGDNNRIALTIKELLLDPWDEIATRYSAGTLVRGTITKLTKFGAFARIEGTNEPIEGLIHISELSDERVEHPGDVITKGDTLTLRVVRVEIAEKRLGLSVKKVYSPEFLDEDLRQAFENPDRVVIPVVKKKTVVQKAKQAAKDVVEDVKEEVAEAREKAQEVIENIKESLDTDNDGKVTPSELLEAAREKAEEVIESIKERLQGGDAEETPEEVSEETPEEVSEETSEEVSEEKSND